MSMSAAPDQKLSLQKSGSAKTDENVRKRQTGIWVIHPYSNWRLYWDCVTLILLIITMIFIPISITFFNVEMSTDVGWITFHLFLDSWFFIDILINFHTGIIVEDGESHIILDIQKIRQRYCRSWFLIDLISTLPFDYVIQFVFGNSAHTSTSRAVKLLRFVKLLSLLRLLRLSRLIRYVHQWEQPITVIIIDLALTTLSEMAAIDIERLSYAWKVVGMQYDLAIAVIRIFNLVCLMLLIGHWNGCLQFLVPMLYDFPEASWVRVDDLLDKHWGEQYSWCLFKAMSHMLSIGYGQQTPQSLMDLWMTMISMVSGAVCFAMFIGHATALIQSMDTSKRQYKEKYTQVKEYMRFRHLPKSLRAKVYKYYEIRYQGKMFDEVGILYELSSNLRQEIINYNCRHLVRSVNFFKNADKDFVTEVVQKLKFEIYQPTDEIVKEGAVGKTMYFIQHGIVEIRKHTVADPIMQLSDGSFFGEICLLIDIRRTASVVALTNCNTYSLHVDDFNTILPAYPNMRKTLEEIAATRMANLGVRKTDKTSNEHSNSSTDDNSSALSKVGVANDELSMGSEKVLDVSSSSISVQSNDKIMQDRNALEASEMKSREEETERKKEICTTVFLTSTSSVKQSSTSSKDALGNSSNISSYSDIPRCDWICEDDVFPPLPSDGSSKSLSCDLKRKTYFQKKLCLNKVQILQNFFKKRSFSRKSAGSERKSATLQNSSFPNTKRSISLSNSKIAPISRITSLPRALESLEYVNKSPLNGAARNTTIVDAENVACPIWNDKNNSNQIIPLKLSNDTFKNECEIQNSKLFR